jgi:hypothetical protein
MYRILFAIAFCGVGTAQQLSLGIFLQFEKSPSAALVDGIGARVERLLRPAGISPSLRLLAESKGREIFSEVLVVKVKGSCSGRDPAPAAEGSNDGSVRLAATAVRDGQVTPWAEVECDAIRGAIMNIVPAGRAAAMGEALAKVIAHESFHLLLNTTSHGARGLARSALRWDQLLGDANFCKDDLRRLRSLRFGKPAPK